MIADEKNVDFIRFIHPSKVYQRLVNNYLIVWMNVIFNLQIQCIVFLNILCI